MTPHAPEPAAGPPGQSARPERRAKGSRPSAILVFMYAAGTVIAIGLLLAFPGPTAKRVPYSDFKQMVRAGQVAEVVIDEHRIRGTAKGSNEAFETTRIEDSHLLEELERQGVKFTGETETNWWSNLTAWLLPLIAMILLWGVILRRMNPGQGAIAFERSRAKSYAADDVKVTFADVAGIDEATEELREGVLLVGRPGTGKTLLARAVAGEAHVPFFSMSGSEFVEMFVGVGAARIRDLFQQAEAKAPCIVFIDELDALGKARVQSALGSHEEREQTLNQLLAEMDGFDTRKGVIIMGATNRPEVLDVALLRPGRFDRQVLVDKPDVKGREAILRSHTKAVKTAADVDLRVIAARTAGFAGADLANLVNEAALLAARTDKTAVDIRDFESAIDRLIAGLEKKRVMSTKERKIVAYHESGHAIVATMLPGLDPVHKISIVQRGFGALGYTMQLPLEDRYLMTRGDLLSQLAVLLGGRTAEEIALGEISTGAQNDLQRATDIARAMVTEFGMSDALGAINYEGQKRARFLDIPLPPERGLYGEETAQRIDAEITRILNDAHNTARRILEEYRGKLETVTTRLLEIEVMEGAELRALIGIAPPTASPDTVPLPAAD